ncbi:MAG: amino acid adenylation domain-containing protein [Verrucomicrobiae bacterium]|nr:amino acid adenylation domain-containing protein [Verrucomicrobiae bacterium]
MSEGGYLPVLRGKLGELLFVPLSADQDEDGFVQLGVDSVVATELIDFIRRELVPEMSVSAMFDYPCLAALAGHLEKLKPCEKVGVRPSTSSGQAPSTGSGQVPSASSEPASAASSGQVPSTGSGQVFSTGSKTAAFELIAVVGMAGRFPGAENVGELWERLASGFCAVSRAPSNRGRYWDTAGIAERAGPAKPVGGFLGDVEGFDPVFFGIAPREAAMMDPQQRLFLEAAWQAVEDAGYAAEALNLKRCGVYAGVMSTDYQDLLTHANASTPDVYELMGSASSILAARTAYHLNLRGPAIAVDTACSSSLVAIHLACRALQKGELDWALAGGVTLYLTQKRYNLMEQAGMLSKSGVCRPFDEAADGMVPGEAVGVVLLKRLTDAVADGDAIYGVIRSSGMNQAGRTSGITTPSMLSQLDLLREVYREAEIDPATLRYVEAHGTGTSLGDPIEIEALTKAFGATGRAGQFCRLGSLKANLGHTSGAAGVAGLIKVLLCLKHRAIPPQIHFQTPNRHMDYDKSPFRVNTQLEPWENEDGQPRRAGVSSLGFSGVNAHLVVEEAPVAEARGNEADGSGKYWITLSARTGAALAVRARELLGWMEREKNFSMLDLSFTLNAGRTPFEERLAFAAADAGEAADGLRKFLEGKSGGNLLRGRAAEGAGEAGGDGEKDFEKIGPAWVAGGKVDWSGFYREHRARRIHLPGYPFEHEPYWYDLLRKGGRRQETPAPQAGRIKLRALDEVAKGEAVEGNADDGRVTLLPPVVPPSSGDYGGAGLEADPPSIEEGNKWRAGLQHRLQGAPEIGGMVEHVKALVAELLCLDEGRVSETKKFVDLGLDSILAVELAKRIATRFSISLPAARLYDYPTVRQLAEFVGRRMAEGTGAAKDSASVFFPTHLEEQRLLRRSPPPSSDSGEIEGRTSRNDIERGGGGDLENLLCRVRGLAAGALYLDEEKLDLDKKFADLGFDSILAVELAKKISAEFKINFSAALLYEHPTTRLLAEHLGKILAGQVAVKDSASVFFPTHLLKETQIEAQRLLRHSPPPSSDSGEIEGRIPRNDIEGGGLQRVLMTRPGEVADLRLDGGGCGSPAAHEVQISVAAASVMMADMLCLRGLYPTMPPYPFTPGFEVAGVVTQAGERAAGFRVGDRVYGLTGANLGGHAAAVNVDARLIDHLPGRVGFDEAAGLPVAFLTAYHSLFEVGKLAAGESLLIHSAASSTGLMAIQLARRAGVEVLATAGADERVEYLRSLGVEKVWNYHDAGVMEKIRASLPGGKVNAILNLLTGPVRDASMSLLAPGGRFLDIAVGGLKASAPADLSCLVDNQGYFGIDCRRLSQRQPEKAGECLRRLSAWLEKGEIRPLPVSRKFALAEAREAYRFLEERKGIGRIVLVMAGERNGTERMDEGRRREETGILVAVQEPRPPFEPIASSTGSGQFPSTGSGQVFSTGSKPAAFEPIAIIGMAGRFPGAGDVETFWGNLAEGKSFISTPPEERRGEGGFFGDEAAGLRGGFLEGIARFDADFFNMARAEAEQIDPQQRLFLQEAWKALEDAGYAPRELAGRRCGVFVGICTADYYSRIEAPDAHSLTGNLASGLAGRVAYVLDWTGPCLAVDTACSSSFSALHLACESLRRGECELALMGGVHVAATPKVFMATGRMGLLSPGGCCRTFAADADGWVIGEGVGAVILKRLSDAVRDGDSIYAVIRGCGINQDGAKNGFTAPKASSQTALQRRVYEEAGIRPDTIDYVEAHGMSTVLGDEMEMLALRESFSGWTRRKGFCAVGSIKPNIGHPIAAAGVACLIKVALALKHRRLPPLAKIGKVNEALGLEDSPFYLNTALGEWKRTEDHPRRAAINGLGATGTNCHLILEEAPVAEERADVDAPVVLVFSARDGERLRELAAEWVAFLERLPSLADAAFTLQVGRQPMVERLALVVSSVEEAKKGVAAYLSGADFPGMHHRRCEKPDGAVELLVSGVEGKRFLESAMENRSYDKLARLWVGGIEIDWHLLYAKERPRRISLPVYPFARESYWITDAAKAVSQRETRRHGDVAGMLRNIIAEVLRCEPGKIDLDDDLFCHGFGSLYVLRVVERFAAATGGRIPPRVVFECRTVRDLARRVEEMGEGKGFRFQGIGVKGQEGGEVGGVHGSAVKEKGSTVQGSGGGEQGGDRLGQGSKTAPLSEGQRALWSIQVLNPKSWAYHLPIALWWEEPMDGAALRAALEQIQREQPVLRTVFSDESGEPSQRFLESRELLIRGENCRGMSEGEMVRRLGEWAREPFDLEKGPLWRARTVEVDDRRNILFLEFHHLVFDGWSLGLLLEDLERYYRAALLKSSAQRRDVAATLGDAGDSASRTVRCGFGDFVASERAYMAGETFQRDRDYWLGEYPAGFERLNLPREGNQVSGRPPQPLLVKEGLESSMAGEIFQAAIPQAVVRAVEKLAAEERVTAQSVFLTAFEVLLAGEAKQRDVAVGMAVDARPSSEFEDLMGYFVNLLPIRAEVSPENSFRDLLKQVFGRLMDAFEHRRFPFRQLCRALAERDGAGARHELDAAFYFHTWNTPERRKFADRFVKGVYQTGEFNLVFEVAEGMADWHLNVKYRPAALGKTTVENLAGRYLRLLEETVAGPDKELEIGEPEELGGVPVRDYPRVAVHELIEAQVAKTPEAVAAVFQGQSLTYRELDARANQLAHYLSRQGVGSGSLVGVMIGRSLEMLEGLLAVWKTGAGYVPLDPAYPAERLDYILTNAEVKVLLTQSACVFSKEGIRRVELDVERAEIQRMPADKVPARVQPDHLAYVIYTSGSTGQPKGVQIAHRSLSHFLWCMARAPGCAAGDKALALTTICFDIAALELYLPLTVGACVEILSEDVTKNGLKLKERVENSGATIIQATPATWKMLLAAELGKIPRVKALCGGEAWNGRLAEQLLERVGELWNMYGPTETTVWSSIQKVEPGQPVRLGEPIGNTQFYVFDEEMRPAPRGGIGELFIGGEGLARGYLNQPELTRERFIRHPTKPGELIYRTGDLVRYTG